MSKKLSTEQFIEKAKLVHGNKYDYSLVEYKNSKTKVKIKCNDCGRVFEQFPFNHLDGHGCKCNKRNIKLDFQKEYDCKTEEDFAKEYFDLIEKNLKNIKGDEIHHILPKSIYPLLKNKDYNLVYLSFEDHYRAHYLLSNFIKNKMALAFRLMIGDSGKEYNPKLYAEQKAKAYEEMSIKVFCFELNKEYNSIREAAKSIKLKTTYRLRNACKNWSHSSGGFHWCYLEDKEKAIEFWSKIKINKIIILETEQIFDKIIDCAKKLNVSKSTIHRVLCGQYKTCKGYHICYLDNYNKEKNIYLGKEPKKILQDYSKRKLPQTKKIVNLFTEQVFDSIQQCADYYNIDRNKISQNINNHTQFCKGWKFCKFEDFDPNNNPWKNKKQYSEKTILKKDSFSVVIAELEKYFRTQKECADFLETSRTKISTYLNSYYKGYHLVKFEDFDPSNNPWKGLPRYNQPKKKKTSKPNELKNKIICLETEEVKTVEEWAKVFKCHKATIYNSLKGNKTRLRNHFCFLEDYKKEKIDISEDYKVVELNSEMCFHTIRDCANFFKIKEGSISDCLRGKQKNCKGHYFSYFEDFNPDNNPYKGVFAEKGNVLEQKSKYVKKEIKNIKCNFKPIYKSVFCFELNKEFSSLKEASTFTKLKNSSRISDACKNWSHSSGGFHWCYLEDKEKAIEFWKK